MALDGAYGDGFVGVANHGILTSAFLFGDDFTDGSVRVFYDSGGDVVRFEKRVSGIWELFDSSEIGTSNWVVDDTLGEFVLDGFSFLIFDG